MDKNKVEEKFDIKQVKAIMIVLMISVGFIASVMLFVAILLVSSLI